MTHNAESHNRFLSWNGISFLCCSSRISPDTRVEINNRAYQEMRFPIIEMFIKMHSDFYDWLAKREKKLTSRSVWFSGILNILILILFGVITIKFLDTSLEEAVIVIGISLAYQWFIYIPQLMKRVK